MAHGVPLATRMGGETCGAAAFFLDVGLSSTHHIARSWRLHESLVEKPRAAALVSAPIQIASDSGAFVTSSAEPSAAKDEDRQAHYTLDPNAVIAAAFKAAGLPVPDIPTPPAGATPRVASAPIIAAALKAAGLARVNPTQGSPLPWTISPSETAGDVAMAL